MRSDFTEDDNKDNVLLSILAEKWSEEQADIAITVDLLLTIDSNVMDLYFLCNPLTSS